MKSDKRITMNNFIKFEDQIKYFKHREIKLNDVNKKGN